MADSTFPTTTLSEQDAKALDATRRGLTNQQLLNEGFNVAPNRFYYPLQRLEYSSDYLQIKILKYVPSSVTLNKEAGTFNLGTASQNAQQESPLAYIHLPIPQNISDSQSVDWGDDKIDPLSAYGASLVGNLSEVNVEGAINDITTTIENGIKDPKTRAFVKAALVGTAAKIAGANIDYRTFLSRATGQVLNPNLELLFKGPNLRAFPFVFDFAPRDPTEGQMVKNIIFTLKRHMLTKQSETGLVIGTPDIFQLEYKTGSGPHPFLNKFKPAALINMDVNYTGSGTYATYSDATPVHITMTLMFKELNPIYFEEYTGSDTGVGY